MKSATVESDPDTGLFGLVMSSAAACAGGKNDPVGILEIEPEGPEGDDRAEAYRIGVREEPFVYIEAAFAYQGARRVIDRLDVRVRELEPQAPLSDGAIELALTKFGGTRFTNLCAGDAREPEAFDLTIAFSFRMAILAENTLLLPTGSIAEADSARFAAALAALGVSHARSGSEVSVRRRQVRGPMRPGTQVAGYRAARGSGGCASVYAATLPAGRAARVAEGEVLDAEGQSVPFRDVFLGVGLGSDDHCTSQDATVMQRYLKTHLGFDFGQRRWNVRNAVGDEPRQRDAPRGMSGIRWPTRT